MSAGICIMNKNAIALAADSAVTIGPHLAIHNSANKLFALSKVAPVGAIIYSNAEVMGSNIANRGTCFVGRINDKYYVASSKGCNR